MTVHLLSATRRHLLTLHKNKFSILLGLTLSLTGCMRVHSQNSRLTPLPQDAFVQVYFNHAQSSDYQDPYRQQDRPGDDLEQLIVDTISQAKSSVDVAVQELRLPKIAQALVERQKAGVRVRVILENTYSRPWSTFTSAEVAKLPPRERNRYNEFFKLVDRNEDNQLSSAEINQGDALILLRNAGIPMIDDTADGSKGSSLMHNKFVIIDDQTLIVTSANFTTSDTHGDFSHPSSLGNANNLLKIKSSELANLFTQEFNIMWGDGPAGKPDSQFGVKKPYRPPQQVTLGNTTITVQFSPTSIKLPWNQSGNGLISKTLNSAVQSVNLALFVFSDQRLGNLLETRHQQGVEVKALIDPDFAYRPYSEMLDMMGIALSHQCQYETYNHPWSNPISTAGVPQLAKGDLLHHKFGVIDGKTVITGSHNWSEAANTGNDETLLVIQSQMVASHFEREFNRLYVDAHLEVPDHIQQKVKTQLKQCATHSAVKPQPPNQKSKLTSSSSTQNPTIKTRNVPSTQLINLNTATQAELEELPGVGPKLAKEIIAERQLKPFTSLQDLDQVPGVGSGLLKKLEGHVTW